LRVLLAVAVILTAIAARVAHDRAAKRVLQLETEARINFDHGKPEEAERQLLLAAGLAPPGPRAIALLAAVRMSLGKGEQAEKDLRDALARSPGEPCSSSRSRARSPRAVGPKRPGSSWARGRPRSRRRRTPSSARSSSSRRRRS